MIRLGLCCLFVARPIRFRSLTAKALLQLAPAARREKISRVCLANAAALHEALLSVRELGIGAFRILSPLLPRYTHPEAGYQLDELPAADQIRDLFVNVRTSATQYDIRLSFHPDQFVVLSSPDPEVVAKSRAELDYQGMLAEQLGAEVINLHGGGGYGNKPAALKRLRRNIEKLPDRVRRRLTLENDDRTYTPEDLLPVCRELELPLVYDVHHHRCLPDGMPVAQATELAVETWLIRGREPYFHLSSPRSGWGENDPRPHADYIAPEDFPDDWLSLDCTVDVEAKAKELAVLRLQNDLKAKRGRSDDSAD